MYGRSYRVTVEKESPEMERNEVLELLVRRGSADWGKDQAVRAKVGVSRQC